MLKREREREKKEEKEIPPYTYLHKFSDLDLPLLIRTLFRFSNKYILDNFDNFDQEIERAI